MFIIAVAHLGAGKAVKMSPSKHSTYVDKDFCHDTLSFFSSPQIHFQIFLPIWKFHILFLIFLLAISNLIRLILTIFLYQCITLIKICVSPQSLNTFLTTPGLYPHFHSCPLLSFQWNFRSDILFRYFCFYRHFLF